MISHLPSRSSFRPSPSTGDFARKGGPGCGGGISGTNQHGNGRPLAGHRNPPPSMLFQPATAQRVNLGTFSSAPPAPAAPPATSLRASDFPRSIQP